MSDYAWFALFWSFLVLLGLLEYLIPRADGLPRRAARWPANIGLGLINGAIVSLLPVTTVWAAYWAASHEIGLLNWAAAPAWLAIVVTVLARSLAQYAFHRLMHHIPALWFVHRVHHCDEHLDASTGLRFHPLEIFANTLFLLPIVFATGMPPAVLILYESVEILVGILSHTSLQLPERVERALRWLVITPGLHRLHHSDDERQADTNYGTVLSIWDGLFRTYCRSPAFDAPALSFGVKDVSSKQASDFAWLLSLSWRGSRRDSGPAAEAGGTSGNPAIPGKA